MFSVDFDDVLYKLDDLNNSYVKERYGVEITSKDVVSWSFYVDEFPSIIELWTKWELYGKGDLFPGAIEFIHSLKQIGPVQIVTASGSEEISINKDKMIKEMFGDIKIIHTREKSAYTVGTILIDDYSKNIVDHVTRNNSLGLLFDFENSYGWSKHLKEGELIKRVSSYDDILRAL